MIRVTTGHGEEVDALWALILALKNRILDLEVSA